MDLVSRRENNISYVIQRANITSSLSGTYPEGLDVEGPTRLGTSLGAVVMLFFFLAGLVGNMWIPTAILIQRKTWSVINVFIVSLCLNDLLVLCLIVILIVDSYLWQRWTAGTTICKLNPEFTVAFTGCSLWHSAFIAIHRYIVVVHNSTYKRMNQRAYVVFVLISTRLIPIAVTIPGFSLETSGYVPKLLRCILLPSQKKRIVSITLVQIIAPVAIVLICYALVFAYVCHLGHRASTSSTFILQRELRITKMFGVIFLMILIGFVPYAAVRNMDRHNIFDGDVYVVVTVFYGIGTCSNPLVYGAMSTEVRRACVVGLRDLCTLLHCDKHLTCIAPPIQSDADMTTFAVTESRNPSNEANCNTNIKMLPVNGGVNHTGTHSKGISDEPPPEEV